jgi:hypothetical protein
LTHSTREAVEQPEAEGGDRGGRGKQEVKMNLPDMSQTQCWHVRQKEENNRVLLDPTVDVQNWLVRVHRYGVRTD